MKIIRRTRGSNMSCSRCKKLISHFSTENLVPVIMVNANHWQSNGYINSCIKVFPV